MDTLQAIRQLRRDFAAIGDYATCELLDKVDRALSRWDFDKGWLWMERALDERRKQEQRQPESTATRGFNGCALAVL
jgi:hypothetical protein